MTTLANPYATAVNMLLSVRLTQDLEAIEVMAKEYSAAWGRGDLMLAQELMIKLVSADQALNASNLYVTPIAAEA